MYDLNIKEIVSICWVLNADIKDYEERVSKHVVSSTWSEKDAKESYDWYLINKGIIEKLK